MPAQKFDREAFKFTHQLLGHPALSLGNLAKVLPTLPPGNVSYVSKRMSEANNFEAFFSERGRGSSIEETIENIRTSDAYIAVQAPQADASFSPVFKDLVADVQKVLAQRGVGGQPLNPRMYLFIASPNAITPFHFDRYANFLLQFRGRKTVSVFPTWNPDVVSHADREAYVSYARTDLNWTPDKDRWATAFDFGPGEAIHIPFAAGHHVRNGPDDVSIFFDTDENLRWRRALSFNHYMRRALQPLNVAPAAVGERPALDRVKSLLWGPVSQAIKASRTIRIKR
jgi:hypothetical protein